VREDAVRGRAAICPLVALIPMLVCVLCSACRGDNPEEGVGYTVETGGSAARGHEVIEDRNCGTCHTIPGVRNARGIVASPLFWYSRRTFIAGEVPNTPDNLIQWVRQPQAIEPKTAMPALGLTEQEARDVAAYLYTLR
jgi:cytochrome c